MKFFISMSEKFDLDYSAADLEYHASTTSTDTSLPFDMLSEISLGTEDEYPEQDTAQGARHRAAKTNFTQQEDGELIRCGAP